MNSKFSLNKIKVLSDPLDLAINSQTNIISIHLQTSNDLLPGSVVYFGFTSGCENILSQEVDSICTITYKGLNFNCNFSYFISGFEFQVETSFSKESAITLQVYGISVGVPTLYYQCKFSVTSYMTEFKNDFEALDYSGTEFFVVNYVVPQNKSALTISQTSKTYNVTAATSEIQIKFVLENQTLVQVDQLILDMGSYASQNSGREISCFFLTKDL